MADLPRSSTTRCAFSPGHKKQKPRQDKISDGYKVKTRMTRTEEQSVRARDCAGRAARDGVLRLCDRTLSSALARCHKKQKPRQGGAFSQAMPSADGISRRLRLAFYFFQTVERRFRTQRFFNTDQLVVLGNAVRAAHRTGFDLACCGTDRQVSDGGVFGFT